MHSLGMNFIGPTHNTSLALMFEIDNPRTHHAQLMFSSRNLSRNPKLVCYTDQIIQSQLLRQGATKKLKINSRRRSRERR